MNGTTRNETPQDSARRALVDSRKAVNDLHVSISAERKNLETLKRQHGPHDERVVAAGRQVAASEETLKDARQRALNADVRLNELIRGSLGLGIDRDVARLSAQYPIVMLPVRIETRFKPQDNVPHLWLRIYPDEIVADFHEPELTEQELEAGKTFWRAAWNPTGEADAWKAIVSGAMSQRAAWIVKQTTASNLATRPTGDPVFAPDIPLRTHSWTRAAEAHLLPDRWLVLGYRNGKEVLRAVSGPVKEPLQLTLSPTVDPTSVLDVSGDGLKLDPELIWTIDFPNAEAAGMALRIPLGRDDMGLGFSRLLVLGVKSTLAPDQASDKLAALFDSHHYTRGLAIVPQGTPTNNTTAAPSPFPPPDPGGANSYPVELGPALAHADSDGGRFASAFGVPIEVAAHIENADRDQQKPARAMAEALWPVTWGYYIETLLAPASEKFDTEVLREYYLKSVRARGHYPTFRIGNTPYGILPVSSLSRWRPGRNDNDIEIALSDDLRKARSIWLDQVNRAPRTGGSSDPDADLLAVLGMDASTREVRIRQVLGADLAINLWMLLSLDPAILEKNWARMGAQVGALLGVDPNSAEIFRKMYKDPPFKFRHPFVEDAALSETNQLKFNYVRWLRTVRLHPLRKELFLAGGGQDAPTSLLYRLLRHATLTVLRNAVDDVYVSKNLADTGIKREVQLVQFAGVSERTSTVWERMEAPVTAVSGTKPIGQFLLDNTGITDSARIAAHMQALLDLENLPTAELERLLTETLDVCSHRIDAWISSLPAKRLSEMRVARPLGSYIGAYAWVEDLVPRPQTVRRNVELSRLGVVGEQVDTGGHVLAPSMIHAAAAAVLRNGYLTRSGAERSRYAVDLSSARVRKAQFLLDAVRNGQPLGAVLGYQFERGLHEGHRPRRLDKYKEPFRRLYPLPTNTSQDTADAQESIAARDVVDGMKLRDAWKAGTIPWGQPNSGLPGSGQDRTDIETELALVDESVDAAADLLLAEGVYQIARGSMRGAAATLDSMSRGIRPPDPEIAHLARSGSTLTHRFALVVGGEALPGIWPGIALTERATTEPRLDAWVGTILGDPASVKCRVSYLDPTGADPEHRTEIVVTLADLEIRPLDLLTIANAVQTEQGLSELDQRVGFVALLLAPETTDLKLTYERGSGPGWERETVRTFPEILEVARAINELLGGARALRPADLLPADTISLADSADTMPGEANTRADNALTVLKNRRGALDGAIAAIEPPPAGPLNLTPIRDALKELADYGFAGVYPTSAKGDTEPLRVQFVAQGQSVLAQADRRITSADAATNAVARVAAIFGREFVFLPRFKPAGASELDNALAASSSLVTAPSDVPKWFQSAARVRSPLNRWRKMALYSGALGNNAMEIEPAQLPFASGARWAALDFADEEHRHRSGLLSLALARPVQPAATDAWAGLLIDEWTEVIPNADEAGAVTFHFDSPGAEAGQAVLIAVPPAQTEQWDLDSLIATLNETIDLAKIRAVDGELLEKLSQLLPAIYLTMNTEDDTISTVFTTSVMAESFIGRVT
jgi:hypothetical protein